MYKKFIKRVEQFISRDIRKKSKYEDVLAELNSKIKRIEAKKEDASQEQLNSLKKLVKKTKLMIDSL